MKKFTRKSERFIKAVLFFVLFFITVKSFPIFTAENYNSFDAVNSSFPIAITENGKFRVVKWAEYKTNPERFAKMLITVPAENIYEISNGSSFDLALNQNVLSLMLNEKDYQFWSKYVIENGQVKPIAFKFNGPFSVFYGFIFALFATWLLGYLYTHYLTCGQDSTT